VQSAHLFLTVTATCYHYEEEDVGGWGQSVVDFL